jgi:hypothetical protein
MPTFWLTSNRKSGVEASANMIAGANRHGGMPWTDVRTTVAAAASSLLAGTAHAQTVPKAKNVVLVQGLFADGSSWSEVIPR